VEDPKHSDVIPVMLETDERILEKQREIWERVVPSTACATVLVMSVFWADDGKDTPLFVDTCLDELYGWIPQKKLYVHTALDLEHPQAVFYDCLLRRTQAMFRDQQWQHLGSHWLEHADRSLFDLADIPLTKKIARTFLAPIRIYPDNPSPRMAYRRKLRDYFQNRTQSKTAYFTQEHTPLPAQSANPPQNHQLSSLEGSVWQPIHNSIYENTLASAYVETIPLGPNRTVTEKTWDPLVKGHFVLPFAYPGFLKDLHAYGVKLPEFINYDYDCVNDHRERFKRYLQELERLRLIPIKHKQRLYLDNREILEHNRKIVLEQPVQTLRDALESALLK
jgi:hypothetical protein